MNELQEYLNNKNCFKLICGAGNENYKEITNLCAIYSKAGCRFFDINASVEAIRAAKKGIEYSIPLSEQKYYSICVSIGAKNDPHILKYKINSGKCQKCGNCQNICPQNAITDFYIDENKCIGCQKCREKCNCNAIDEYQKNIPYEKILPDLIKEGIDCIEYHAATTDEKEIENTWKMLVDNFEGALSICLNRSKLGNEQIIRRLQRLKDMTKNQLFMVQADGAPMTGGKDDYRTTLQAVAMADIVDKANITDHILLSGGTNTKTMKLAKLNDIFPCGIAMGSFARKAVKEFIERDDLLTNPNIFNQSVQAAKKLITESIQ